MSFAIAQAQEILEATPAVLHALLSGLSDAWLNADEGPSSLDQLALKLADLNRKGTHPALGPVTLQQLLATWVVHDFTHLGQIVRVMARRYAQAVGPWTDYLGILSWRRGENI